jgi:hypothetical protein
VCQEVLGAAPGTYRAFNYAKKELSEQVHSGRRIAALVVHPRRSGSPLTRRPLSAATRM